MSISGVGDAASCFSSALHINQNQHKLLLNFDFYLYVSSLVILLDLFNLIKNANQILNYSRTLPMIMAI